jgi:hypothetical protein
MEKADNADTDRLMPHLHRQFIPYLWYIQCLIAKILTIVTNRQSDKQTTILLAPLKSSDDADQQLLIAFAVGLIPCLWYLERCIN